MNKKLSRLKTILGEVYDLAAAIAVLDWDQQVNMPPAGSDGRAAQLSLLSMLVHEKFTGAEIGDLLAALAGTDADNPDSDTHCLLKVVRREYERKIKVPASFVAEFAHYASIGHTKWEQARAHSDFSLFQDTLSALFDLRRQYAGFFAPYQHVYDPLLEEFEPGLTTAEVQEIFARIRPEQVNLIRAISECPEPRDDFLYQELDIERQWQFGVTASTAIGFDWTRGRQDKSVHPFTTTLGANDIRITTRISSHNLPSGLFSTLHESGHGMYEQGIAPELARTPLATGASLGIHESQSRLWENIVGRSKNFWIHFYPKLRQTFPGAFDTVTIDDFYRGINKVKRSLIRVESDEATYNLHIMLRLEIEIAALEGKIAVKDLPEYWNEKMREYLGLTPPDAAHGILQDVHWAGGAVGYFPTYALGNIIAAQLWEQIMLEMPDVENQIRTGDFAALRGWLSNKIYCHGAKYEPQTLVKMATGHNIDPAPYLRYLNHKYREIYSL